MLPGLTSQQKQYLYELHNKSAKEAEKNLYLWLEGYDDESEAYYVYDKSLKEGGYTLN